jgi:hypothetical protein
MEIKEGHQRPQEHLSFLSQWDSFLFNCQFTIFTERKNESWRQNRRRGGNYSSCSVVMKRGTVFGSSSGKTRRSFAAMIYALKTHRTKQVSLSIRFTRRNSILFLFDPFLGLLNSTNTSTKKNHKT